ncbi:MAG: serine hydrolase [bacterium]
MNKFTKYLISIFGMLALSIIPLSAISAADNFNPNNIISDEEMQSVSGWSIRDIQKFLDSKGGYIKDYYTANTNGFLKSAAEIIYDAAKQYVISPKFLLVTLQKEQSLISSTNPSEKQLDWATGYAVCDSCKTTDPKIQKYKGFGNQVDNAAGLIRWYYDNKDVTYLKKKDQILNIDGQTVIPETWATAFLYNYTPHIHGNKNFWNLTQKWFKQYYPNGTILESAENGDVWLIQGENKRKFKNKSVLISRENPNLIIKVPESELSKYIEGTELNFPNYSLLQAGSKYYLLDSDTLRPFASRDVLNKLGYNPQEIIEVSQADLIGLDIGSTITLATAYPHGVIYKIIDNNGKYYFVKDNKAYPLLDESVVKANYSNLNVEIKTLADLKKIEVADTLMGHKDGTLLQIGGSSNIYVIEKGKKRKFADETTFTKMGYNKSNITEVSPLVAMNIITGETIFYDSDSNISELNDGIAVSNPPQNLTAVIEYKYKTSIPAYLIAEYPSGKIIAGKNIDKQRPIASFVKVMVAYEALNQGLDFNKSIIYSDKLFNESGYALKVANGSIFSHKDVLNSLLIGSYNNMANVTAAATGLTKKEFLTKVNNRLVEWGAKNTNVDDLSGLSEKNLSTPRDLLNIYGKILKNRDMNIILMKKKHDFWTNDNKYFFSIENSNKMDFDDKNFTILASKTGYTDEAKSVLFLLIKSKSNSKKYIIITMGNSDYANRFDEPKKIANWISTNSNLTISSSE